VLSRVQVRRLAGVDYGGYIPLLVCSEDVAAAYYSFSAVIFPSSRVDVSSLESVGLEKRVKIEGYKT
jgi:hypothetical protein